MSCLLLIVTSNISQNFEVDPIISSFQANQKLEKQNDIDMKSRLETKFEEKVLRPPFVAL